jgi:PAS domain S-box-containing protein
MTAADMRLKFVEAHQNRRLNSYVVACVLSSVLLLLPVANASPPRAKRILIVHSFGSVAPPFTTHSIAFETELVEKMDEPVDLDEVSLDNARYGEFDMQEALVEYLQKRQAKWQPDIVVPVGSPAGVFVAQYREKLFPNVPVLYCGMDRRRLPADAFKENAVFVGENFDVPGFVEDILQIAPRTKNIAIVLGASPLEKYWADTFRKAFEPFASRVNFIWLDDLPFEHMLERVKKLPPDSFILLGLLLRDAAGVTHNADEALQRLHAVANAPINGIFQHQLGLGIVGGRLYQAENEGIEAARIAVRILHGEPTSKFPPQFFGRLPPRYDWRELQRWKIDEKFLPPGSIVSFRAPTVWQEYRTWIIAGVSLLVLQALLISALLANLIKRRRAEHSLTESEERSALATEAAQLGVWEFDTVTKKVWVSEKTRELFQFDKGEITYADFQERVHPEDRAARDEAMQKAIDSCGSYEIEFRVLLPDETVRWMAGRVRCISDGPGKPIRMLGVSADITQRKVAENEARDRREQVDLLGRVSLLGEMTASLAHELNQPLSAIVNNATAGLQYLQKRNLNPDQMREIFTDVVADGQRAYDIMQNVRRAIKKGDAIRGPVNLNDVVKAVVHIVHPDAALHSCKLETSLAPHLRTVDGDPTQLQQVLINLAHNGFDAMRTTPRDQRTLQIATEDNGDGAINIAVRDHGSGISEATREHLFEHFFTTKEEGLGMGLAIVRSIIEAHGGHVAAENVDGGGARFYFSLPTNGKIPNHA